MTCRVLVIDDDELVLRAVSRQLVAHGFDTETAGDVAAALERLSGNHFDVILSDINMPRLSGIDFLRELRRRDLDVPVVLMTAAPQVESAMEAINLGAFSYVAKPFDFVALELALKRAARFHDLGRLKRQALALTSHDEELLGDSATLDARFQSALKSLFMVFQPIVSNGTRKVVAYEALLRTEESSLRNPVAFVTAAERLGHGHALGRAVRAAVARAAPDAPRGVDLFVNLHASDLIDDELAHAGSPLTAIASRVVLEITERASIEEIADVPRRVQALRALGFRIAIDDLGAGYAGLSSLTTLNPEIVKLDMTLVRGIDTDPQRQRIVESLISLCRGLEMRVVIEGVETRAEGETVIGLGGDVLQGYWFQKPARGFGEIAESAWLHDDVRSLRQSQSMSPARIA